MPGTPMPTPSTSLSSTCGLADHGRDAFEGEPYDMVDVVAAVGQRQVGRGPFGQREVEQLDPDPGFADVDADDVPVPGRDLEQDARAAAVGLDGSGLLDHAVGDQLADDVADGPGAQAGVPAQLLAAQGPFEIQMTQKRCTVAAPQVTHGPLAPLSHRISLSARPP